MLVNKKEKKTMSKRKNGIVEFCGGRLPDDWICPSSGRWSSSSAPFPYQVETLLPPSARRALDDMLGSYDYYDDHPAFEYVVRRCVLDLVLGACYSEVAWERLAAWMTPRCLLCWSCLCAEIVAGQSGGECSDLGWLCCLD